MNKYVEDCPCGNPYPHGVEFAGRYQFVCDKCGRKTKWFYNRNIARYSWKRKIRYNRKKETGVDKEERILVSCVSCPAGCIKYTPGRDLVCLYQGNCGTGISRQEAIEKMAKGIVSILAVQPGTEPDPWEMWKDYAEAALNELLRP